MSAAEVEIPAPFIETHASPGKPTLREFNWQQIAEVAPILATTMLRYLDQIALSLRPTSVTSAEGILRRFAGYKNRLSAYYYSLSYCP